MIIYDHKIERIVLGATIFVKRHKVWWELPSFHQNNLGSENFSAGKPLAMWGADRSWSAARVGKEKGTAADLENP
jgi:hypothetical protein